MIWGLDKLLAARKQGFRPNGSVTLFVGCEVPSWQRRFPWWSHGGDIDLYLVKPSQTDDLRPLIGLFVTVSAESYSAELMEFAERLKQYARCVVIYVNSWGGDEMIGWTKAKGQWALKDGVMHG